MRWSGGESSSGMEYLVQVILMMVAATWQMAKKFSTWVNCVRYSPSGKLLAIMANSKLNSDTKECVGGNDSHGHPPSLDMRIQECDTSKKQVGNDDANSKAAARPHPFNSHANVLVRSYILNRVKDIASSYDHVSLDFDLSSNASWAPGLLSMNSYAVYYESDNVLLQVEESDEEYQESGGLLLSAHWDSVSTAPGATDNGMGVVMLLSMVKYFAENRPSWTVVFNINNDEEDGLNGTHVASVGQYTDTFLNLEGAAARGRPLLFRTTSRAPLASWSTSRSHANVITGDAFSRGVIRSGTDYSVYEQAGLTESVGQGSEPVYFDFFGAVMIVFTFQTLQIVNILLLTVGPVILLMLVYFKHTIRVTSRIRSGYYHAANGDTHCESFVARASAKITHIFKGFWVWFKFWIASLLVFNSLFSALTHLLIVRSFILTLGSCLCLPHNSSRSHLPTDETWRCPCSRTAKAVYPSPSVMVIFDQIWEKNAPEALLCGHIEFVPLNFLEESPVVGKDVYYLRSIIHDWPDNESMVILHECVLLRNFEEPDVGANVFSKDHEAPEYTLLNFGSHTTHQLDLLMWLAFNGKERTLNEFKIIAQVPSMPGYVDNV
ncbi:hypothetical protein C8R48DRAFT_772194 [Suillus tomentosus]|nr:hypothetical protein C8R48DRAFT_772194 [Suillus tomentosus]